MEFDSIDDRSPTELREWQLSQLLSYLEFARENSRFYADTLDDSAIDEIESLDDFREVVPLTRKEGLIDDQTTDPPYGSRLAIPESAIVKVHLTSGTSGKGREVWAASAEDVDNLVGQLSTGFPRIGLTSEDTVFNTLPIGTSAAGDWLSKSFERLGANVFNVGSYSTKLKVELMDRFDVTAVFATPSYLEQLQNQASELDIDLEAETIMTATDNLPESQVEKIERQWNGKLYEEYGVTEGSSLWTCGRGVIDSAGRGTIHFAQEYCYYEVVDPGDPAQHVSSGDWGELVITPFACRRGMPLVRFATGDRVRYVAPDECSCELTVGGMESGTIGRYDDMLKIKGLNVWPQAVDEVVFSDDRVREYQGRVTQDSEGRETVTIELEWSSDDLSAATAESRMARLESELAEEIGISVDVTEVFESLPDYSSAENKADRWTDDRYE